MVTHGSFTDGSINAMYHPLNPKSIAAIADSGLVDVLSFGYPNDVTVTGSGIVISRSGLLVTNNHVIAGAKRVEVAFGNPTVDYPAQIVAQNPQADIAILQAIGVQGLHPLPWLRTGTATNGTSIAVIGNAYGYCETPIVATGQIMDSNLGVTIDYSEQHKNKTLPDMIAVNAQVIPGDSGGAVVNSHGIVLGMTTATNQQAHEGYAIAAPAVLKVIQQLLAAPPLHYSPLPRINSGSFHPQYLKAEPIIAGITSASQALLFKFKEARPVRNSQAILPSTLLPSALLNFHRA